MSSADSKRSRTGPRRPLTAGFTIVEVLIVLAIAGLILLIVFEAVPALNRNSQNSERKQDVSAILQAVSHFELNNSANFPTAASNFLQFTKLNIYTASSVSLHAQTPPGLVDAAANSNVDTVEVWNYERCDPNNQGLAKFQGADYTGVVALYAIDTGSSTSQPLCQQL